MKTKLLLTLAALLALATIARAQGTAFTYQGRLNDGAAPATGIYDLRFAIYDAPSAGTPQGSAITNAATAVSNGLFTVTLDFGASVFTGPARWLAIEVRPAGGGNFTPLSPRQEVTSSPYAIRAQTAGTAADVNAGTVVKSLNGLRDDVTLAAGTNVTITPAGNTLTIAAAGAGGSGIWSVLNNNAYYTAGNVGIGTSGPLTPLEVNGIVRSTRSGTAPQYIQLNGGDSGSIKLTGQSTPAAEKNLFIQNLSGEATPGPNNNIQFELGTTAAPSTKMTITKDGNVGIGTTSPQDRLHVFDPAGSVSQRIETGGGVNAWSRTEYANANGQWNVGTSVGFVGDQLYFHRQGFPIAFAIQPNGDAFLQGNLGIGTTTPGAKLHAETGSANAAAIYGNATGAGGVGVYGQGASGSAVFADGNARQTRDKGGFVKAMLYVAADGTIIRGFNSFLNGAAATTPPCGFTSTRLAEGQYVIDFGFQVSDRFLSITPHFPTVANFDFGSVTINQLVVRVSEIGNFSFRDSPFMVIVY